MIFRFGRQDDEYDEDEEEIELVSFQDALDGRQADLRANARLVAAGLNPAKEFVTDGLLRRAEKLLIDPKGEKGAVVRVFVDGVPYSGGRLGGKHALVVTQVLKLLAGLDVQNRKTPQSGGIKAEREGTPYLLLVDSRPVGRGYERLTVRIRNQKELLEKPEEIGFTPELKAKIREWTADKTGILVACGPPDSGVSTTALGILRSIDPYLFSLYSLANLRGRNLLNVTDFQPEPGDDLDTTIGRLVRAEADGVFVDPITDAAAARTLFKWQEKVSIISEVPARDAAHGIVRLGERVGDPAVVAGGVKAAIAPRLIRLLCSDCRQAYRPHPRLLAKIGLPKTTKALYRPPVPDEEDPEEEEVCEKCGGVGYFRRTAIFEVIEMTEGMRSVVAVGPSPEEIHEQARKEKMPSFRSDGLRLVTEGRTSLEELQRIFRQKT